MLATSGTREPCRTASARPQVSRDVCRGHANALTQALLRATSGPPTAHTRVRRQRAAQREAKTSRNAHARSFRPCATPFSRWVRAREPPREINSILLEAALAPCKAHRQLGRQPLRRPCACAGQLKAHELRSNSKDELMSKVRCLPKLALARQPHQHPPLRCQSSAAREAAGTQPGGLAHRGGRRPETPRLGEQHTRRADLPQRLPASEPPQLSASGSMYVERALA